MAENLGAGDEKLDNPKQIKSEIPSDTDRITISPEKAKTIEETENMEVHHHPQLHHEPKPWKEYFLEFIMIFLAVTLGFFAENIREHFVETARAKEYAQSLYDDLKADTAIIQRTYNEKAWIEEKFDSAENMLSSNDIGKNNEFLYYIERYLRQNDVFTSQEVTYQQLRSSGNFRYIKNVGLYKNIADYYNLYARYQSIDGIFGGGGKSDLSLMESKLFNLPDLNSLDNDHGITFYNLVLPSERKLEPISKDKQNLNLFYIKIAEAKRQSGGSKIFLGWLKSMATGLMKELRKEYQLD